MTKVFILFFIFVNLNSQKLPFSIYEPGFHFSKNYVTQVHCTKRDGNYYYYNAIIQPKKLNYGELFYGQIRQSLVKEGTTQEFKHVVYDLDNKKILLGGKGIVVIRIGDIFMQLHNIDDRHIYSSDKLSLAEQIWHKYKLYVYNLNNIKEESRFPLSKKVYSKQKKALEKRNREYLEDTKEHNVFVDKLMKDRKAERLKKAEEQKNELLKFKEEQELKLKKAQLEFKKNEELLNKKDKDD